MVYILLVGVVNKSEVKSKSRMKIITEIIITKNKILLPNSQPKTILLELTDTID